jgi:steroid delta-isomerase-like uncharacterized protein
LGTAEARKVARHRYETVTKGQKRGTMTTEENRATLFRYADALNRRDLDTLSGCLADDVESNVTEDLGLGQGRDAFLEYIHMSIQGVPDAHIELFDVVAQDDRVAARYRGTGTHEGDFLGIPPSGNPVELEVGLFVRFNAHGEIVDYRSYADILDLMQQLGAIPKDMLG